MKGTELFLRWLLATVRPDYFILPTVCLTLAMQAQPTVVGRVVNDEGGAPIVGAVVRAVGTPFTVRTDEDGRFEIPVSGKDAALSFRMLGFETVDSIRISNLVAEGGVLIIRLVERPIGMKETVITAGRREQSLLDVPVSVSTIGAEDLEGRGGLTIEEPLRFVSGVNIMDDQINIRGSSGYSRGVGSRVLLLFDGIPLLTGDTGEIIWETLPTDFIEKIEIVKGAGSALYGSSALGGVINVLPKRAPTGTHVIGGISVGIYQKPPYETWTWSPRRRGVSQARTVISHGDDSWNSVWGLTATMDESHRRNDAMHRYALYNRSVVELPWESSLTIAGHFVSRRAGNFFWWKNLLHPLEPPDEYGMRRVESDRGFAHVGLRKVVSATSYANVRLQYFRNVWRDLDADVLTTESTSDRWNGEIQWTQELHPSWNVVAGATTFLDRVNSNIFGTHPGVGVAGFVQNDFSGIEGVTFAGGVRYDWQKVSALAGKSHIDPRIGATVRIGPATSLRASAGTGYRYPSIGEFYTSISTGFGSVNVVPNPDLRPEKSVSSEIGLYHPLFEGCILDASLFQTRYDALIEASVDPDELVIRFENVERARIQGFEASLSYETGSPGIGANVGYTYVDARNRDSGDILRFRPRHVFVASVDLRHPWVTLRGEYRFVSRVEAVDENLVLLAEVGDGLTRGSIHVVNLRGDTEVAFLGAPIRLGVEVRNALNYQYVELLANLAPPRTFVFSLESSL